jgi:hypothetical protein
MGTMGTNKPEHQFDWEYGEKIHGYGWKKGQRHQHHTHPVMIATLNCCYYYCVEKGGNQVWGPRAWEIGTEEMDGMRRDLSATVPAYSTAHAACWGKRKFGAGRQGREGKRGIGTIFLFPCVLVLGVFFCVYDHFLI